MDDSLRIELFGGFRATYAGKLLATIDTPRLQALLAYVALRRGTPQSRQQIAFTLWPGSTEQQAFTNLRKLVHVLRKALPDAERFLRIEARTITWLDDGSFTLDVATFERLLAGADEALQRADPDSAQACFREAVECYQGELLPGLYDDWIVPDRERLHREAVRALEGLIGLLESRRDYEQAIRYGGRLVQLDRLREPSYRLLMRLHALHGDRAGALRIYRDASSTLLEELDTEPEPATRALHVQLTKGELPQEASPAHSSDIGIPLVGRRVEWNNLLEAWGLASQGAAHFLIVTGVAGIGKTRLAEELLVWAARQGLATARSRAYAAEGRMAFAPIIDWLRSGPVRPGLGRVTPIWLTEMSRLLPELRQEHPELQGPASQPLAWERQRLFEALARGLLASGRPMLLLLDDVQWCDRDTLEWLRFLFRFAPSAPLLVVGTVRVEEIARDHSLRALLLDLGRTGQVTEVTLEPLDAADTTSLAAHVAQRELEAAQAARLFDETEGHPLFVVESVRAGLPERPSETSGQAPHKTALLPNLPATPPLVQAVLRKRLAQLSPKGRALASLAAAVGRTFSVTLVRAASTQDEIELSEALDELWQRRIIRAQEPGVYDFSHDKLRETAYDEVAPSKRRLIHRRIAEALEVVHRDARDAISGQLAFHYEQGGLIDQAIASYERAAQTAQRVFANDEVVRLVRRALELLAARPEGERRDEQELALLTTLGPSLIALRGYSAGEATDCYERARELCQRLGQPSQSPILRALGSAYVIGGSLERGYAVGEELLEAGHQKADSLLIVEGQYVLGISSFWMGQFARSREHLEQALAHYDPEQRATHLALYAQDPHVVCLSRLAWTLWYLGFPEQSVNKSRECLARALDIDHPFSQAYVLYFLTHLFIDLRDERQAEELVQRLLTLSRQQCFPLFDLLGGILQGWLQVQRDAVQDGIALIRRGIEAMPKAEVYLLQSYCLALLAQAYLKAGSPGQGLAAVSHAFAFIERYGERFFEAELHRIRGALLLTDGEGGGEPEAEFRQAIAVARRQQARSLELRAQIDLSRLWYRQGRIAEAQQSLGQVYELFAGHQITSDVAEAGTLLASWS